MAQENSNATNALIVINIISALVAFAVSTIIESHM
jgi:hypothetical protein